MLLLEVNLARKRIHKRQDFSRKLPTRAKKDDKSYSLKVLMDVPMYMGNTKVKTLVKLNESNPISY